MQGFEFRIDSDNAHIRKFGIMSLLNLGGDVCSKQDTWKLVPHYPIQLMWICSSQPNTPSLLIQTYIVERFLVEKLQAILLEDDD